MVQYSSSNLVKGTQGADAFLRVLYDLSRVREIVNNDEWDESAYDSTDTICILEPAPMLETLHLFNIHNAETLQAGVFDRTICPVLTELRMEYCFLTRGNIPQLAITNTITRLLLSNCENIFPFLAAVARCLDNLCVLQVTDHFTSTPIGEISPIEFSEKLDIVSFYANSVTLSTFLQVARIPLHTTLHTTAIDHVQMADNDTRIWSRVTYRSNIATLVDLVFGRLPKATKHGYTYACLAIATP
ncbi:unnamed protein product [Peniophora sp. CBMAI 1063]|nr:unnamed protein product [Peniophora sp. CBMAI 1063]